MKKLFIVRIKSGGKADERLDSVLAKAIQEAKPWGESSEEILEGAEEFCLAAKSGSLRGRRIIFAISLDETGVNLDFYRMLAFLQEQTGEDAGADSNSAPGMVLDGAVGGVIVDGRGNLHTKDVARRLVFSANMAGCTFPGKPLVEATGSLQNFHVAAKLANTDRLGAYEKACGELIRKLLTFEDNMPKRPSILMVHASSRKTSNSLSLWSMVRAGLEDKADIEEISIRNGQVWDCRGCKYEDCKHFGESSGCFYGGVIVEKVYPAIIKCDTVVLVCPNYNDAISANLMAFINRLTAVFFNNDFSRKRVYAIVVSGYSGGDIVASQIIGAMNMNKSFVLPSEFAMIETANSPGDVEKIENIGEKAAAFGENILKRLL